MRASVAETKEPQFMLLCLALGNPLRRMLNKLLLLSILTWLLRHWILTMMIWRSRESDRGGLSLLIKRTGTKFRLS